MKTKAQLIAEVIQYILTGGNRTTAANVRTLVNDIIYSYQDIDTSETGIIATAGGNQANAYQLTKRNNRIDTVGSTGDPVKLTDAVVDAFQCVINNAAANTMNVYPKTGECFLGMAINAPYAVTAGGMLNLYCFEVGVWTLK